MIHCLINQFQKEAGISRLCRLLDVSRSGLYAAKQRQREPRPCIFTATLKAAFQASGSNYGSRRLSAALKVQGLSAGRYRVRRLMAQYGLKARWKRKFVHTTDSRHDQPVAANVLDRQFNPSQPARSSLGGRYHLHPYWARLAVPGCGAGSVLTQDRGLGDGAKHASRAGLYGHCKWPSPCANPDPA